MLNQDNVPPHEQTTQRDPFSQPTEAAWPPPPRTRKRQRSPGVVSIVLITIALLLIVSGLGFIVFTTSAQYNKTLHTEATAQARLTARANATKLALTQQATNQALATQQAYIYATASALVGSTATAQGSSVAATATAGADENLLNQDTGGTPVFNDALGDNSSNNGWDTNINPQGNTGCQFNNGAYHALEAMRGYLQPCFAEASNFSNFAYQVTLIIDQGDQGGIIFRANNAKSQYYLFRIGIDGSYTLERYTNNQVITLSSGFSVAIATGTGQSNTLAVIANKSALSLFANSTYIASVTNSTLSSGQIGVVALDFTLPTDVEFSNAQVWTL
ncbi:MAG TPA: hypothetical protein VIZ18_08270 [Ktedonobacteraceae bacterium]